MDHLGFRGRKFSSQTIFTTVLAGGLFLTVAVYLGLRFYIGDMLMQDRIDFLGKLPFFMLGVGIVGTAAGAAYVRSAAAHEQMLASLNRSLTQKNRQLNNEISERERLNDTLHRAEGEYKAIIDAVSDIIFEVSTEGRILFINNTWQRITGFDKAQAKGRNLFDMLHPRDQDEQRRSFEQMVRGERQAYRAYARIRTSDGQFRAVELSFSMMRQDENKNLRVVGAIVDIEERRRAEKALGEAEKKYRTIVEHAAGGIYQVTPEGQFLSANPAMARILGYDSADQLLREITNANETYEKLSERSRFIRELEQEGIAKNFETKVITRGGRKIWINENARVVKDEEGNILYYEGSIEDITKRKEAEIRLQEAMVQSDLASRAKSEFLANMSHELRTPLNAIIGFSEIIKDEVLGPIGNKQYWEYVRDIYDSGNRLLTIINEILDVSRIQAGERQLNEGIVDLTKASHSAVEFMWQKAEASQLTIVNLVDGRAPKIVGEELAVKQILLNLLSNAIKFTPQGGHITLSYEMDMDGQLRLSITDTGIGLDEFEIAKALSPFGQISTALNRSGSGAGLGLTLVDSLMQLHGGSLELFSQKGVGTTATVVFPARRVEQSMGEYNEGAAAEDKVMTGLQ